MPTTNICPTASRTLNRLAASSIVSPFSVWVSSVDSPEDRDASRPHPASATRTTHAQKAETERQKRLVSVFVSRLLATCCRLGDSLSMRGVVVSGILCLHDRAILRVRNPTRRRWQAPGTICLGQSHRAVAGAPRGGPR